MTKQKATTSTYQSQNTTDEKEGYARNIGAGFMQVQLEVLAINSAAYPNFGSALTNTAKH